MNSPILIPALLVTTTVCLVGATRVAEACGCVAPPNPATPVVQAGERIVFAHDGREVTAHIQIQYEGEASEFGWIVPVPTVPDYELGSDEVFNQAIAATQPRYSLNFQFADQCGVPTSAGGRANFGAEDGAVAPSPDGPLVLEKSVGPFDGAVLSARDKTEMLDWLQDNGYFVPVGTEDVMDPYIQPNGYFLALKLRSGETAGNIQPIVLKYESAYPMIPIILTSVAANPEMGVQVWMAGEGRAIPRNYRHTIINEEFIDWFSNGANYNDVVIAATNEAEEGQSFVTEYAGPADVMDGRLWSEGRYTPEQQLASLTDPRDFIQSVIWSFPLTTNFLALMQESLPMPAPYVEQGWETAAFYQQSDWLLDQYASLNPEAYAAYASAFDAAALAAKLHERIVEPLRSAQALFDANEKLTRMYTTLSPEEMTRDPVFAVNPDLPDVSNEHVADFEVSCEGAGGILRLPDGREFQVNDPTAWAERRPDGVPFSARIETLFEEGPPQVEVDNSALLSRGFAESSGCSDTRSTTGGPWLALAMVGLVLALRRRAAGA